MHPPCCSQWMLATMISRLLPLSLTSLPHLKIVSGACGSSQRSNISTRGIMLGNIAFGSLLIKIGTFFTCLYRRKYVGRGKYDRKGNQKTKSTIPPSICLIKVMCLALVWFCLKS